MKPLKMRLTVCTKLYKHNMYVERMDSSDVLLVVISTSPKPYNQTYEICDDNGVISVKVMDGLEPVNVIYSYPVGLFQIAFIGDQSIEFIQIADEIIKDKVVQL